MAKVRVPKELRPPERFKPFDMRYSCDFEKGGTFRVMGVFRVPKKGECYWSPGYAFRAGGDTETTLKPRVILEKVSHG